MPRTTFGSRGILITRPVLVTGPTLADSAVAIAAKRDARVMMMKAYGAEEEIEGKPPRNGRTPSLSGPAAAFGGPVCTRNPAA